MNISEILKSFTFGLVIGALCTKLTLSIYLFDEDFFWSLLSQILGGGIVAIFSFYFLSKYSTLLSKPKLKLVVKQNGIHSTSIEFKKKVHNFEAEFDLSILNTGNKSLNERHGYWHFFVVGGIFNYSHSGDVDFVDKNHMRNIINIPVFPKTASDLNLHLKISFSENLINDIKIYCFLSTEYGNFPKKALIDDSGEVLYKNMQNLPIIYT